MKYLSGYFFTLTNQTIATYIIFVFRVITIGGTIIPSHDRLIIRQQIV